MAGIGNYKPIKLVKYTSTINQSGDSVETAQTRTFWAEVTDSGGGRTQVDGRTTLSTTKQFKVYFRQEYNLNADWKIFYFGQKYAISNMVRIDEKRFNWLITANVQS